MNARSICVLGGSGLGYAPGSRARARQLAHHLPTRDPARARQPVADSAVKLVAAEIHEPVTLASLLAGSAWSQPGRTSSTSGAEMAAGFETNHVELVRKLAEACESKRRPPAPLSALNADADDRVITYLRSKGRGERIVRQEFGLDMRWTIFQPSVIFGPRDVFVNRFARLLRGIPLGLPLARPGACFAPV